MIKYQDVKTEIIDTKNLNWKLIKIEKKSFSSNIRRAVSKMEYQ